MNILVINCGSSSIKSDIINSQSGKFVAGIHIERVQELTPVVQFKGKFLNQEAIEPCPQGMEAALKWLVHVLSCNHIIHAVGHRVVHGGKFDQAVLINKDTQAELEALIPLAPLHNPANTKGIYTVQELLPELPQVAVFDTAFHQTMPKRAVTYALPKDLREKHNLRRYGFHGTSHQYVAELAAEYLKEDISRLRIISCHLGNGASVAAIEYGRSVETSMGMTPLEGLVMGTRSGDLDPAILLHIAREEKLSVDELDNLLNKQSGLKGLSGGMADMRDILQAASEGNEEARLAVQVFTHRLRKYIGAYAAVMGGVDAIIFTGGIGEHSPVVRHRSSQRLDFLGAILDEDLNHHVKLNSTSPIAEISTPQSKVKLLVAHTDEQHAIALQTAKLVTQNLKVNKIPAIPIAISARHVHLTQETVDILFGKGYQLTEKAPLSQPGQFACNEQVTLIGPKNTLERVRILGPVRPADQVEISRTDEFFLGIDAPIRESGKVENSPGIKIKGPKGEVTIKQGVICAWRHIHMHPEDAAIFGVEDKDIVEVAVGTGERPLTFGNVLIRVSENYKLEMHIDTDEANAAELSNITPGVLVSTDRRATLLTKKIK